MLGVVANLALWFALHVVFTRTHRVETPWNHAVDLPDASSLDPVALAAAILAAAALIRLKANMLIVIAACGAIGLLRAII